MPFVTYQLANGGFATSSVNAPDGFVASWEVSEADAYQISIGAGLEVVDGALIVHPVAVPEEVMVEVEPGVFEVPMPVDGDF